MKANLTLKKWWRVDAVGVGVLVALTAVVYVCGYYPLMRSHQEYQGKRVALAAQREQSARLETTRRGLQKRLAAVSQSLSSSSLSLKPAANLNNQLAQISALATGCGLAIADVRTEPAVAETHSDAFPVTLAGGGTYRACTVFLGRMRETFQDTTVVSLDLTGNGGDPSGIGKFNFRLRWHAAPKPVSVK